MEKAKTPITEEFYHLIKNQIVTLKLMPDQLLMVRQLADDNGISRTPAREALIRLKDEGLVVETTGNKFRVSEITWKFIKDFYETRIALEKLAVDFAAKNANSDELDALDAINTVMDAAVLENDFSGYFQADMEFHAYLFQILNNDIMSNLMKRLTNQQQRIRYLTMGKRTNLSHSLTEHRGILCEIRKGNHEQASALMEAHLRRALTDILSLKDNVYGYPPVIIKD